MNINVYLEERLAKELSTSAKKFDRKRNAIIREAIEEWLSKHNRKKWSDTIMQFKGCEDFPDVKALRKGLHQKQ